MNDGCNGAQKHQPGVTSRRRVFSPQTNNSTYYLGNSVLYSGQFDLYDGRILVFGM